MSLHLTISANFRTGTILPTIEQQYHDLWTVAKMLESFGLPLVDWYPPADSVAHSLLNSAFTATGPSPAALAMANADRSNQATDLRSLGVWNGNEEQGGAACTALYVTGRYPSTFDFSEDGIAAFSDYRNVLSIVQSLVKLWNPMAVKVEPSGYATKSVFQDRPPVGWMIYLPFAINARQVPEAAHVIPIKDNSGKKNQGTVIVSVAETFDVANPDHIKTANAIETRLVDQDLLPTLREFVTKF